MTRIKTFCFGLSLVSILGCATPPATPPETAAPTAVPVPYLPASGILPMPLAIDAPVRAAKTKRKAKGHKSVKSEAVPAVAPAPVKPRKVKATSAATATAEKPRAREKHSANDVVVKCVVRLPDDQTEHSELCRNFRIVLIDEADVEVTRFRFDGDGIYRFKAGVGKTYRLNPQIGGNWKFSLEPNVLLKAGDHSQAVFVQLH